MATSLRPTRVVTVRPLVFSKAKQAAELLPAHRDHKSMPAQLSDLIRRLLSLLYAIASGPSKTIARHPRSGELLTLRGSEARTKQLLLP